MHYTGVGQDYAKREMLNISGGRKFIQPVVIKNVRSYKYSAKSNA